MKPYFRFLNFRINNSEAWRKLKRASDVQSFQLMHDYYRKVWLKSRLADKGQFDWRTKAKLTEIVKVSLKWIDVVNQIIKLAGRQIFTCSILVWEETFVEYTRSWDSSRIMLVAWSKPFRIPCVKGHISVKYSLSYFSLFWPKNEAYHNIPPIICDNWNRLYNKEGI